VREVSISPGCFSRPEPHPPISSLTPASTSTSTSTPLPTADALAEMIRSSGQPQEDGTVLVPHAFFRALFASGLLPEEAITRLSRQLGADDEDDEDVDGEEWDEDDDDEEDDDDDDDDDYNVFGGGRFRRGGLGRNGRLRGWDWFDIEREGKEAGKRLARGGEFGRVGFPQGEEVRTETDATMNTRSTIKSRSRAERSGSRSAAEDVLMERDDEDELDLHAGDDEHALSTSPTSTIATHLSRSPTTTATRGGKTRRCTSSSSSINLTTSPRVRSSSASSLASMVMGIEDDGRVKGIKSKVTGRGPWVKGMKGFGRETGRGVWGSSGREEWSKVGSLQRGDEI